MVAGVKDKARVHEDAKSTAQRTVGKVSSKVGTARKSKTKKRRKRKTGKRRTRLKCNGLRMRSWRRVWNEGGKEVPCRRTSCKKYLKYWCMNACHKVKE